MTPSAVIHDLGCTEPCTCGAWDRAAKGESGGEFDVLLSIEGVNSVDLETATGQGDDHERLVLTLTDGRRIRIGADSSDHFVDINMWAEEA